LFGTKASGIKSTRNPTNQPSKHSKLRGVLCETPKPAPKKSTESTSKKAEKK
jgi:hypothetical protein